MSDSVEVLEQLGKRIDGALKRKNLREVDRINLEVHQFILLYLIQDHPRTSAMWQVFKPMAFLFVTGLVAFVTAVISGRVQVVLVR